jgi:spartin
VVTGASNYYINHSKPVEAKPGAPPSRAAVFLSSERTKRGLNNVHAFSGQAVKVSAKTINVIDGMIKSAVGNNKGKGKERQTLAPGQTSAGGSRSPSPGPPSRLNTAPPSVLGGQLHASPTDGKPPLPPRNISRSPSPGPAPPLPPRKVSTTGRLVLSADLILSTLEHSAKQLIDVGSDRISAVVGHRCVLNTHFDTSLLLTCA